MRCQNLAFDFQKQYGRLPSRTYFSPGRVNLIGEYTDVNGGYVLPAAINRGTYFAVGPNSSDCVNVISDAFDDKVTIPLTDVAGQIAEHRWSDYIKGVLIEFSQRSMVGKQGLDIFITGDLPRNSGLSSSASITAGTIYLLNDMWQCGLGQMDVVKSSRSVENNFIGLQCGIMDPFAVVNGRADHAICLNCDTLESKLIPFTLDGYELIVTDSRVPRKLSESFYNQRGAECAAALEVLQRDLDIGFLCGASVQDVEDCRALQKNQVIFKRARHVVGENQRVLESAQLLSESRLTEFGELMYASHQSLRDDFEVSCAELDILVDSARNIPGVLGSRMTGAGFGGCTISIVATSEVPNFVSELSAAYAAATPYEASILHCRTSDGVRRLND